MSCNCNEPAKQCEAIIDEAACVTTCSHTHRVDHAQSCGECTLVDRVCYHTEPAWEHGWQWGKQSHRLATQSVIDMPGGRKRSIPELFGPPLQRWYEGRQAEAWNSLAGMGWIAVHPTWEQADIDDYVSWRRQFEMNYAYPDAAPRKGTRDHSCSWVPQVTDGRHVDGSLHFSGWLYCGCGVPHNSTCPRRWLCLPCVSSRGNYACNQQCTSGRNEDTCTAEWSCPPPENCSSSKVGHAKHTDQYTPDRPPAPPQASSTQSHSLQETGAFEAHSVLPALAIAVAVLFVLGVAVLAKVSSAQNKPHKKAHRRTLWGERNSRPGFVKLKQSSPVQAGAVFSLKMQLAEDCAVLQNGQRRKMQAHDLLSMTI